LSPIPKAASQRPSDESRRIPLQGKSLEPILDKSREAVRGPSDWLGWELFGNRAIREGNWKLLWLCKPYGPGKWQLYDLKADPAEMNDVADEYPKVRNRLVGHWRAYADKNNVIMPSTSPICRESGNAPKEQQ